MLDFILDKKYLRSNSYSALGNQNKYYKDGYWYKEDVSGYEGKVEYLASVIMQHSNISDYVIYEECLINGKSGCRSKNFLQENESYVSFQQLYDYAEGGKLSDRVYQFREPAERIEFVLDFIHSRTDLDCRDYLQKILTLDMLILNPDRHFHNLGVIRTDEKYKIAPIFDNGAGLFSNFNMFPPFCEFDENLRAIAAAPFSGSLEQQALAAGIGLKLDYGVIDAILDLNTDKTRATEVLKEQLKRYKRVIPELEHRHHERSEKEYSLER